MAPTLPPRRSGQLIRRAAITATVAAGCAWLGGCAGSAQDGWAQSTPILAPTVMFEEGATTGTLLVATGDDAPPLMAVVGADQFPE